MIFYALMIYDFFLITLFSFFNINMILRFHHKSKILILEILIYLNTVTEKVKNV